MDFLDYVYLALFIALYILAGMSLAFFLDSLGYKKNRALYDYQLWRIMLAWPIAAPWYWQKIVKR